LIQRAAFFASLPVRQILAFCLRRGSPTSPRVEARTIAIEKLRRVGRDPGVINALIREIVTELDATAMI
jgi:phospholipid/cholesterol/gamma-HCH transport system ATP-binding protein